jgi:hypothetical protein
MPTTPEDVARKSLGGKDCAIPFWIWTRLTLRRAFSRRRTTLLPAYYRFVKLPLSGTAESSRDAGTQRHKRSATADCSGNGHNGWLIPADGSIDHLGPPRHVIFALSTILISSGRRPRGSSRRGQPCNYASPAATHRRRYARQLRALVKQDRTSKRHSYRRQHHLGARLTGCSTEAVSLSRCRSARLSGGATSRQQDSTRARVP